MTGVPDDDAVPEVIWTRPERPARGPRPTRSRAEIVTAAVGIADRDGIDALSMRRVAAAVGLGTMSLYRYVPAKEDLLELMLDAVSGEHELPETPSGDWRAAMMALARQGRTIMHRHPWMSQLVVGRPSYGPNVLRYLEYCLSVLREAGVERAAALEIVSLINAFVSSYAASEMAEDQTRRRTGRTAEQQRAAIEPYMRSVVESGKYPLFAQAITESGAPPDADAQFGRVLGRLVDGLVTTGG